MAEIDSLHQQLGYPTVEVLYAEQRDNDELARYDLDLNDFFQKRFLQNTAGRMDKFSQLRGVCKFAISGLKGGVWVIESDSNGLRTWRLLIATTYNVFCELIEGRKTAINAYEQGEITGDDNIFMALEFGRLVFGASIYQRQPTACNLAIN